MKRLFLRTAFLLLLTGPVLFADNTVIFDQAFKNMAFKLAVVKNKLPHKTIAIYGFEVIGRPGDEYAVYATEKLTHEIVNEGSLLVIERVVQSDTGIILASVDEYVTNDDAVVKDATGNTPPEKQDTVRLSSDKKMYSGQDRITIACGGLPGNKNDWITLVKASDPETTYGE